MDVSYMAIPDLPLIQAGDSLPDIIADALVGRLAVRDQDILVLAQKIVSKAEGAVVDLNTVQPSARADELSLATGRDARLVQVYLDEAVEVLDVVGRMVITRHRLGLIGSNSFVDSSNVGNKADGIVVLLPLDPDASARRIAEAVYDRTGARVAVIINDSVGRADRDGSVGSSIGVYGMEPLRIEQKPDLFGNVSTSRIAIIDEIAAGASVLMGQANQGVPAVLVRGISFTYSTEASLRSMLH